MGQIVRFGVSMDSELLTSFDELIEAKGYQNRSEAIRDLAGSMAPIEHRDLPVDDPKVRQPDIDLARRELDWSPATPIPEGLEKTMADFRRRV